MCGFVRLCAAAPAGRVRRWTVRGRRRLYELPRGLRRVPAAAAGWAVLRRARRHGVRQSRVHEVRVRPGSVLLSDAVGRRVCHRSGRGLRGPVWLRAAPAAPAAATGWLRRWRLCRLRRLHELPGGLRRVSAAAIGRSVLRRARRHGVRRSRVHEVRVRPGPVLLPDAVGRRVCHRSGRGLRGPVRLSAAPGRLRRWRLRRFGRLHELPGGLRCVSAAAATALRGWSLCPRRILRAMSRRLR